jgi:hypothetical protein
MSKQNFISKIADSTKLLIAKSLNIPTLISHETYGRDVFYQTFGSTHTFSNQSLKYLLEIGLNQNPAIFGALNRISINATNLGLKPYKNGKLIENEVFDLDIKRAVMQLTSTGTLIIKRIKPVGFSKYVYEIIDTLNYSETYLRGQFKCYETKGDFQFLIPIEDLIFITIYKTPDVTTNLGLSPIQASLMPVESMRAMYTADTSLLKNKGADGVLTNDSDEPFRNPELFHDDVNGRITDSKLYGKIATSTARLRYVQIGRTPKELALWDGYKIKVRDIASALMVDPSILGDPDSKKYSNVSEAQKAFYTEAVIPYVKLITTDKKLMSWLGYEIFIDTSNIECLQQSQKERYEKNQIITDTIINLNKQIKDEIISVEVAIKIMVQEWNYDEQEAKELFK